MQDPEWVKQELTKLADEHAHNDELERRIWHYRQTVRVQALQTRLKQTRKFSVLMKHVGVDSEGELQLLEELGALQDALAHAKRGEDAFAPEYARVEDSVVAMQVAVLQCVKTWRTRVMRTG